MYTDWRKVQWHVVGMVVGLGFWIGCFVEATKLLATTNPPLPTPATTTIVHKQGVVMPPAHSVLANAWDDTNPMQSERMYCVVDYSVGVSRGVLYADEARHTDSALYVDSTFRVWRVVPAQMDSAGFDWAVGDCPPGQPLIHTHPPASCYANGCLIGGEDAWQSDPSVVDWGEFRHSPVPFDVVQVDRHVFRFFYITDTEAQAAIHLPIGAHPL